MQIPPDPAGTVARELLEDGSLALRARAEVWEAVAAWLPRIPAREPVPARVRAWIDVGRGGPAPGVPESAAALRMGGVEGWVDANGRLLLRSPEARVSALVDPPARHAAVRLVPPPVWTEGFRVELFAGMTLAAAFLLGRVERTLAHAGAVVAPDGRAWLLVGGSFSGKSTTCVNLIRAGWDYLADDHVVLSSHADGVRVEGWPRRFNLDHGFAGGVSQGVRGRVEPERFGPGAWRRSAPLGGILLPRVEAEHPTVLEPISGVDALSALLQQGPWLLADPGTARAVLDTLMRAARMPALRLRLGADTYNNWQQLRAVLASLAAL
jgi:hypothetical protein